MRLLVEGDIESRGKWCWGNTSGAPRGTRTIVKSFWCHLEPLKVILALNFWWNLRNHVLSWTCGEQTLLSACQDLPIWWSLYSHTVASLEGWNQGPQRSACSALLRAWTEDPCIWHHLRDSSLNTADSWILPHTHWIRTFWGRGSSGRNQHFKQVLHWFSHILDSFPEAAVTNYQELGGLKQQKYVLSQFWRAEV